MYIYSVYNIDVYMQQLSKTQMCTDKDLKESTLARFVYSGFTIIHCHLCPQGMPMLTQKKTKLLTIQCYQNQ